MFALGFKTRVDPFCMLSHLCDPQIHLWCDTCWLYRGKHSSLAFLIHVSADHWWDETIFGYAWKGVSGTEHKSAHYRWDVYSLTQNGLLFSGASIGCLFTGIVLKNYEENPDDNTATNQTASVLRETIVQKSCGVDFCLNKEKEQNLYSIVHFNNFTVGAITQSPRPEEEPENLFGTTPVSNIIHLFFQGKTTSTFS